MGDTVHHLHIVEGNPTIGEYLSELPWYLPKSVKKTDGSAIRSIKAMKAVKTPWFLSATNTQAGLLATQHPHHRVPNSEIELGNIIPGSPDYVPCKLVSKNVKPSKNMSHIPVDMTRSKKTMTKAQMAKLHKELWLAMQAKQKERHT